MKLWRRPTSGDYAAAVSALLPWLVFGVHVCPSARSMVGCRGMAFLFRWLWGLGAAAMAIAAIEFVRLMADRIPANHAPGIALGLSFVMVVLLVTF